MSMPPAAVEGKIFPMSRLNSVSKAETSDSTMTASAACSKSKEKNTETP